MKKIGVIFIFLFLLPCLVTFMFGNLRGDTKKEEAEVSTWAQLTEGRFQVLNETDMGQESIPLELYVADKLARTMDADREIEALKAQAILIRSGLFWEMEQHRKELKDEKASFGITDTASEIMSTSSVKEAEASFVLRIRDEAYGSVPVVAGIYQAVAETAGFYLTYSGRIVPGAYFAVSNGATRNGEELGLTEYPYLKSVLCSRDFLAENYSSSMKLREDEFAKVWETLPEAESVYKKWNPEMTGQEKEEAGGIDAEGIQQTDMFVSKIQLRDETMMLYRDSVGYILFIEWQGKCVSGEVFRSIYHVMSASFHLSVKGEDIVIKSKGAGHGLGLSQFAANEMAKEGSDVQEILNYFFKDTTITKIE